MVRTPHDDVNNEPPAVYQRMSAALEGRYVQAFVVVRKTEDDGEELSTETVIESLRARSVLGAVADGVLEGSPSIIRVFIACDRGGGVLTSGPDGTVYVAQDALELIEGLAYTWDRPVLLPGFMTAPFNAPLGMTTDDAYALVGHAQGCTWFWWRGTKIARGFARGLATGMQVSIEYGVGTYDPRGFASPGDYSVAIPQVDYQHSRDMEWDPQQQPAGSVGSGGDLRWIMTRTAAGGQPFKLYVGPRPIEVSPVTVPDAANTDAGRVIEAMIAADALPSLELRGVQVSEELFDCLVDLLWGSDAAPDDVFLESAWRLGMPESLARSVLAGETELQPVFDREALKLGLARPVRARLLQPEKSARAAEGAEWFAAMTEAPQSSGTLQSARRWFDETAGRHLLFALLVLSVATTCAVQIVSGAIPQATGDSSGSAPLAILGFATVMSGTYGFANLFAALRRFWWKIDFGDRHGERGPRS